MQLPISIVNIISEYVGHLKDSFKYLWIDEQTEMVQWKINHFSTHYQNLLNVYSQRMIVPCNNVDIFITGCATYDGILYSISDVFNILIFTDDNLIRYSAFLNMVTNHVYIKGIENNETFYYLNNLPTKSKIDIQTYLKIHDIHELSFMFVNFDSSDISSNNKGIFIYASVADCISLDN